jgi:hypothetical protein
LTVDLCVFVYEVLERKSVEGRRQDANPREQCQDSQRALAAPRSRLDGMLASSLLPLTPASPIYYIPAHRNHFVGCLQLLLPYALRPASVAILSMPYLRIFRSRRFFVPKNTKSLTPACPCIQSRGLVSLVSFSGPFLALKTATLLAVTVIAILSGQVFHRLPAVRPSRLYADRTKSYSRHSRTARF